MNNFKNFLQESLDRPYKWRWSTKNEERWFGRFTTVHDKLFVDLTNIMGGEQWLLDFDIVGNKTKYANTGKRDSFKILSTVLAMLREFIPEVDPERIFFTGDKEEGKAKLYSMMLRKFQTDLKKLGYSSLIEDSYTKTRLEFTITKDK